MARVEPWSDREPTEVRSPTEPDRARQSPTADIECHLPVPTELTQLWGAEVADSRRFATDSQKFSPGLHKFATGWPGSLKIRDRFADSRQVRGFAT
eukprot:7389040-Prymnesium_polylepis.1